MTTPDYSSLGPAFPQALRLARCQASRLTLRAADELPRENTITAQAITREEQRILTLNASVVSALEDLFSWRFKDRTSRMSVLSPVESWRFRRALYRIWLISYVYGMEGHYLKRPTMPWFARTVSEDSDSEKWLNEQKEVLDTFLAAELRQIESVVKFLQIIADWAVTAHFKSSIDQDDIKHICLFAGPRAILQSYEEINPNPIYMGMISDSNQCDLYEEFLTTPLKRSLSDAYSANTDAGHNTSNRIPKWLQTILDSENGRDDKCKSCSSAREMFPGSKSGTMLWNCTNWDYLGGMMAADYGLLGGVLSQNHAESAMSRTLRQTDFNTLMDALFDSKSEKYAQWSKEDWICLDCYQEFISETMPIWWLKRKRSDGIPIMPDCRHGYYCRKQIGTAGLEHATMFNHLCEPTNFDIWS